MQLPDPLDAPGGEVPPHRRRHLWSRLPLRTQLTVVSTVLLVVGLVLSGAVALTLLERSLIDQLDGPLRAAARDIANDARAGNAIGLEQTADRGLLPSDYQLVFLRPDGTLVAALPASSTVNPAVVGMTAGQVTAHGGEPFTVKASTGDGHWRVLALNLGVNGTVAGSVTVALPMNAAETTLHLMEVALAIISVTVVLTGAFAGSWAVRRSLRPLRRIEVTAAAIADRGPQPARPGRATQHRGGQALGGAQHDARPDRAGVRRPGRVGDPDAALRRGRVP